MGHYQTSQSTDVSFYTIKRPNREKHEYVSAIEKYSDGKCLLNRAKYNENRKTRNRILWENSLIPALIGVALAILLIKLGVR